MTQFDITPGNAFYYPGETVTLHVRASEGARVEGEIFHLTEPVATLSADLTGGEADLIWSPPDTTHGYGVEARLLDEDGAVIAVASTAFDVLDHWLQAPRYGFLTDFSPDRNDIAGTMDALARYHINGLQFYDWQYRHETLLPPAEQYTDPLNRELSLVTVRQLIDAAHAHNIAAMPYTAIYGASPAFYTQHPDWALFERPDHPYEFADGFLIIMDPTPGSPWADHLLSEFARVLEETAFDGIHLDQYGAPMVGRNAKGERVDLAEVFPAFLAEAEKIIDGQRGEDGALIFNAVRNWPVETVAPAKQDAVYIEVWDPYLYFIDLHRLVANAEELGGGKPVIIAAYIHPDNMHNVRLANAMIFGSGGYHLELGEPDAMLADPYFPLFGQMDEAMQTIVKQTYDFVVRYEERLATGFGVSNAAGRAAALTIEGVETDGLRSRDRVVVIARTGDGFEAFNLVNLVDLDSGQWNKPLAEGPAPLDNLRIKLEADRSVSRIWWASPDQAKLGAHSLDFTNDQAGIMFTLPRLDYWTMIVVEYAS